MRYVTKNPLSDTPYGWKEEEIFENTAENKMTPISAVISIFEEKTSLKAISINHPPICWKTSVNCIERIFSKIEEKSGYFSSPSCSICFERAVISISSFFVCAWRVSGWR